jgi:1,2-diacylglycerol 3-alpha-glucosyltransferase
MRIGFATDSYKPYVSGVTHCVSLNRQYLEKQGHEVYVFAFADPKVAPVEPRVISSPGVKVRGTTDFRVGIRMTREARRVLATMDVVNVDNPLISGPMAVAVCRRHGIPVVYTNHSRIDLYAAFYGPVAPAFLRDAYVRNHLRRFCRQVDAVISPTEGMMEVLLGMGVDVGIDVVPNGVDIARFLAVPRGFDAAERARAAHRAEWGFSADDVVFVYSGRLGPEKNLALLVHAFHRVAEGDPRARLLVVGGGPERRKMGALISRLKLTDRVVFTGMVPHDTIGEHLALGDVWVSASTSEVHPLTLIEAMATGLPVVGVHSPGVSDTVEHRVTGVLADREDAGAIAECMATLAADADSRHAMGLAAREASKRYAIESTGAELLGVYELLVREAAAARGAAAATDPTRAERPPRRR